MSGDIGYLNNINEETINPANKTMFQRFTNVFSKWKPSVQNVQFWLVIQIKKGVLGYTNVKVNVNGLFYLTNIMVLNVLLTLFNC